MALLKDIIKSSDLVGYKPFRKYLGGNWVKVKIVHPHLLNFTMWLEEKVYLQSSLQLIVLEEEQYD